MSEVEQHITHVAILYKAKVYKLPKPYRHNDVERDIRYQTGLGISGTSTKGFLDNTGKFLTRRQARAVAFKAGQILGGKKPGDELYSEDVW